MKVPVIAAVVIACVLTGCAGKVTAGPTVTATATVTAPTVTTTVTTTPTQVISTHEVTATVTFTPQPVVAFTDGTFVVGTDIKPGTYKTPGGQQCYFARLSSLDTTDIIDNDNFTGPITIQVKATDKALKTDGGCAWSKVG